MEQGQEKHMTLLRDIYPDGCYQIQLHPHQYKRPDGIRDIMGFLMSRNLKGIPEDQLEEMLIHNFPKHDVCVLALNEAGTVFEIDVVGPDMVASITYEDDSNENYHSDSRY